MFKEFFISANNYLSPYGLCLKFVQSDYPELDATNPIYQVELKETTLLQAYHFNLTEECIDTIISFCPKGYGAEFNNMGNQFTMRKI